MIYNQVLNTVKEINRNMFKKKKHNIFLLLFLKNLIIFVKYRIVMLAENSLNPNLAIISFVCTPLLVF